MRAPRRRRPTLPGIPGAALGGFLVLALAGCDSDADAPTTPAPAPPAAPSPPADARCTEEGDLIEVGFYAFFEPVSSSAGEAPDSAAFHEHRGYEADLMTALEAMDGAGLAFRRRGIGVWPGIWLLSATPEYALIGGGITILEDRTRDADGNRAIAFTAGHIAFRQSLLVRAADVRRLASYDDLTSEIRAGVLVDTTGEAGLLQITGLADEDGVLLAGTRITTPDGVLVADGSADFRIAATGFSENLAARSLLVPPSPDLPQVVVFPAETVEDEQARAILTGQVDVLARGEIGNRTLERSSMGALVVTALDTAVELGGFTVDQSESEFLACLDDKLDYLTDDRNIGFPEWLANPSVFLERAETWTP